LVGSVVAATAATADDPQIADRSTRAAHAEQAVRHGPIGWQSYRNPERLAEVGTDAQTKQFSSFDRADGNDDGFEERTPRPR
jgi:hypothetical protein